MTDRELRFRYESQVVKIIVEAGVDGFRARAIADKIFRDVVKDIVETEKDSWVRLSYASEDIPQ